MWTPFPELDEVLGELVDGVRHVLGEDLVGVYLQGSFALGDADEWSDADFLAVTEQPVGEQERPRLDDLHRALFRLPVHWSQHLEGSYIDRRLLRAPDPARSKLLSLDDRPDPIGRLHRPASDPDDARTLEFVRYASSARN